MSFPTPLSPWFVVQRLDRKDVDDDYSMEYYVSDVETSENQMATYGTTVVPADGTNFSTNKQLAMVFMNLVVAARVARSEGAEIRVLTSKEDAREFRA